MSHSIAATSQSRSRAHVGLFNGVVRETKEMLHEFEEPVVVDSSRFEQTFCWHATPLSESIPTTVEWFRAHPKE